MNYAHRIQQIAVGADSVSNGDFTLELSGKVVDLQVECDDNAGYDAIVGWNESPKDVLIPGKAKGYGVPERGFIDGNTLYINFSETGNGVKKALVTIWKQGAEIC
jgi:hypothetical protein